MNLEKFKYSHPSVFIFTSEVKITKRKLMIPNVNKNRFRTSILRANFADKYAEIIHGNPWTAKLTDVNIFW